VEGILKTGEVQASLRNRHLLGEDPLDGRFLDDVIVNNSPDSAHLDEIPSIDSLLTLGDIPPID